MTMKKVAVAMSGGVDSSVTAALLKKKGLEVTGVFMSLAQPDIVEQEERVRVMADRLGIGLEVVDLNLYFSEQVLGYFRSSYFNGLTPNPCVICNRQIKFGLFLERALAGGADLFATGHYVRINRDSDGVFHLLKGIDPTKDQSYFLCMLRQDQLARACFPLGDYLKAEVYEMAAEFGFDFSRDQESQDVCFLKDREVADYLNEPGENLPGPGMVVTQNGRKVGEHDGIQRFTIGQRRGLGIPDSTPWYVVGLEPDKNLVVVGKKEDLLCSEMNVSEISWLAGSAPIIDKDIEVRIRYRHQPAPADIQPDEQGGARVVFREPQRAITPGQFAAFYRGEELLGGGRIDRSHLA
jgi:tRNA-specific 2-thiouridylase